MSITTSSTNFTLKDISDKFSGRQFRKLLQTVNLSEEETDNLTFPGFESRTVRHVCVCVECDPASCFALRKFLSPDSRTFPNSNSIDLDENAKV